jgi:hypothetical protein
MASVTQPTSYNPSINNSNDWRSDAWHFPEESVLKGRLEVCRKVLLETFKQDFFIDRGSDFLPLVARQFAGREIPRPVFYGILAYRAQQQDPTDLYDLARKSADFWHRVITTCANENEEWNRVPVQAEEKTVKPQPKQPVDEKASESATSVAPSVALETTSAEQAEVEPDDLNEETDEVAAEPVTSVATNVALQPAAAASAPVIAEKPQDEKPVRSVPCCDLRASIQKLWARVFG